MTVTENVFADWLRRQRRQLDLTQAELAQRAGCSVMTIRKLERAELRPSKQLAELLGIFKEITIQDGGWGKGE